MNNKKLSYLTGDDYTYIMQNERMPVIIFFTAKWAENCQQMMETVEKIAVDYYDTVRTYCCDIDEQPLVAMKHNVTNIPHLVLCRKGKETARLVGMRSYEDIAEMIK